MRGLDGRNGSLFAYVDIETRVPPEHPVRRIRELVNGALGLDDARHDPAVSSLIAAGLKVDADARPGSEVTVSSVTDWGRRGLPFPTAS